MEKRSKAPSESNVENDRISAAIESTELLIDELTANAYMPGLSANKQKELLDQAYLESQWLTQLKGNQQ